MDAVAKAFEALGVVMLVVGMVWSVSLAVIVWRRTHEGWRSYKASRAAFVLRPSGSSGSVRGSEDDA